MSDSKHDIIIFGATSFVGQILCRYMMERHGANGEINWAIAGRSELKLAEVRASLGPDAANLDMVVADAADEADIKRMCDSTRVVISTVGPYALYGEPLVMACAESGTDYCDLTGEVQWISRMIKKYEATARKSGARIVHCSGFDSIPSDLGVHHLQQEALKRFGSACSRVKLRVRKIKGSMSGGTVASLMNVMREVTKDPSLRKELANPYSLCAPDAPANARQPNVAFAEYDSDASSWLAPFIMAGINTRIVHRSNALSNYAYGQDFVYDEAMMMGDGFKGRLTAMSFAAGMGSFMFGAVLPPTRWVLEKFVVPKPGEGPSPEAQEAGFFDLMLIGKTASGDTIRTRVTGDRDPGYGSTAKMLGEAGVCLAKDIPADKPGGFWTPATIYGDALIERMTKHAGLTFEVIE